MKEFKKKKRPKKQSNNPQLNFILFPICAHHQPDDEAVNITTVYQGPMQFCRSFQ